MTGHLHLQLPGGAVNTFSLPLTPAIASLIAAGTLKPVEDVPPDVLDGDGGAERVSASLPAGVPEHMEQPAGNATQSDWAAYAVWLGMHPDEAAGLKREELKARIVPADSPDPDATEQAAEASADAADVATDSGG